MLCRLKNSSVTHHNCWDQQAKSLIQWIVIRPQTKYNANGSSTNVCMNPTLLMEFSTCTIDVLVSSNGINDIVDCSIKFFLRIIEIFSNLPHDQLDDFFSFELHQVNKLLHTRNSFRDFHGWPLSLSFIIRFISSMQGV